MPIFQPLAISHQLVGTHTVRPYKKEKTHAIKHGLLKRGYISFKAL